MRIEGHTTMIRYIQKNSFMKNILESLFVYDGCSVFGQSNLFQLVAIHEAQSHQGWRTGTRLSE